LKNNHLLEGNNLKAKGKKLSHNQRNTLLKNGLTEKEMQDYLIGKIQWVPNTEKPIDTLSGVKSAAINELNLYCSTLFQTDYSTANWQTIGNLQAQGISAINAATTEQGVASALSSTKASIANVKTKTQEQQSIVVPNIEFKGTLAVINSGTNATLVAELNQLGEQAEALQGQFQPVYNTSRTLFNLYLIQVDIASNCKTATNIINLKATMATRMNEVIGHISNSLGADANLFTTRANLFREAHRLNQREYNDKEATEKNALMEQLKAVGVKADTIPNAITELRSVLKASMPQEVLPYAEGILNQLEDWAQFDGWTQDLQKTGASMNITRPTTRSIVQGANGIVK